MVQLAARTEMIQSAARKEWYSLLIQQVGTACRLVRMVQPADTTGWYRLPPGQNGTASFQKRTVSGHAIDTD
jgi:hypothetical protein